MKKRLCRWFSNTSVYCTAILIDFQEVICSQAAFVHRTGRDQQLQGLTRSDCAEIPAGSQHPATAMELRTKSDERLSDNGRHGEIIESFSKVCVISPFLNPQPGSLMPGPHAAASSGHS